MDILKINGQPLAAMPWEERPSGCGKPMWRYSGNPVIKRDALPDSNSIFNSAVVPFGNGFAGVFRVDDTNIRMTLHIGFSENGIDWKIDPDTLKFDIRLRPARMQNRGQVLCHLVQRLSRADHRRGLDDGFQGFPSDRKRLSAV